MLPEQDQPGQDRVFCLDVVGCSCPWIEKPKEEMKRGHICLRDPDHVRGVRSQSKRQLSPTGTLEAEPVDLG